MSVVGKQHASVLEMVQDTCEPEFAAEFEDHLNRHTISKVLTVLRCRKEMTQAQVAEEMGCGQAKVSKIERSADKNLGLGDIADYLGAVRQDMMIIFAPVGADGADHIRFHVNAIGHHLDHLAKLAGTHRAIGGGTEAFAVENIRGLIALVGSSLDQLPHREPEVGSPIRVEVAGERGEFTSDRPSGRVRRASKKPIGTP